jgi:polysaccharide export outer membrane protein
MPQHIAYFDVNPDAPYRLGSGDRLRIIVFGQDSLSNSYAVDGTGHISMPLIGSVEAAGQTTASLSRRVEAQLRNGFLREPRVSIEVEAFRPFFILGEVTTPGQYPFISGMTIETAVAVAGGFTPRALQSGADLTRMIEDQPYTGTVPINQLVRPGDTIFVRERLF